MLVDLFSYNPVGTVFVLVAVLVTVISFFGILIMDTGMGERIRNWFGSVKERYKKFKEKRKDKNIWNFNLVYIIFGGIAIFGSFILNGIKEWIIRNKYRITMTIINLVMIVPVLLLVTGVVERLPEAFYPLLVFYFFILIVVAMSRSDNKRHGYSYNDGGSNYSRYPNDYPYGYNSETTKTYGYSGYKYKPKSKGLSEEEAKKKKEKIREKLILNKELKKKYNL